jgi:sugar O-acyltransferase (sialic acid O-acetyltransferase NeuD family)
VGGASPSTLLIERASCRFPGGASTPEGLWQVVASGGDVIVRAPEQWVALFVQATRNLSAGVLKRDELEAFDAAGLNISPAEAAAMDPHQRLLLERARECLQPSGETQQPAAQHGANAAKVSKTDSDIAVYIGLDNASWSDGGTSSIRGAFAGTGVAMSIAANRISFVFGLRAQSLVVDSACSSSFSALHLAGRAVKDGECRASLCGAADLMLAPRSIGHRLCTGMLATSGRCKVFGVHADGYVRSEGVSCVKLIDGDSAEGGGSGVALLRGSALNQDGASVSLTAPNGAAQRSVIGAALHASGIAPVSVAFVEAHGTGTALGDPVEFGALRGMYARHSRHAPMCIGALKSNLGHAEGAAGMASLLKVLGVCRERHAPPNIHCVALNPMLLPDMQLFGGTAVVPLNSSQLPASGGLVATATSMGFGGTNAHAAFGSPGRGASSAMHPVQREKAVGTRTRFNVGWRSGQAAALPRRVATPRTPDRKQGSVRACEQPASVPTLAASWETKAALQQVMPHVMEGDGPGMDEVLELDSIAFAELCELMQLPEIDVKDELTLRKIETLRAEQAAAAAAAQGAEATVAEESHPADVPADEPDEPAVLGWVWPKPFDQHVLVRQLALSIETGQFTNNGPATLHLEQEARRRLLLTSDHQCVACSNGSAALRALVTTYELADYDLSGGILVTPFGFPPILQCNWTHYVTMVDMDPIHGGPVLPSESARPPSAICLVNPFGYRVDVEHYQAYCAKHNVLLWMDNAACPLHLMPDGTNLSSLADASVVSFHETKPVGRGEGGLLIVPSRLLPLARRAVSFGFDTAAKDRVHDARCSNYKMSDFAAAAILMHWEMSWDPMVSWITAHDDEIFDFPPFKRGRVGSLMTCIMERRGVPRPNAQVKHYYTPMATREAVPETWRLFDRLQCCPFHPRNLSYIAQPPSIPRLATPPPLCPPPDVPATRATPPSSDLSDHWLQIYSAVPALESADLDSALKQVGKTVAGKAVDEAYLAIITRNLMAKLDVAPTDRLVDVGCGNGLLTTRLASHCVHVTGVDTSASMIESAKAFFSRANTAYIVGTLASVGAEGDVWASVNKAWAYEVLQYATVEELESFLRAIATRPCFRRLFLAGIPDHARRRAFFNTPERWAKHEEDQRNGGINDPIGRWWSVDELSAAATRCGFTCTVLEQPAEMYTAHYRFDALLEVMGVKPKPSAAVPYSQSCSPAHPPTNAPVKVIIFGNSQLAQLAKTYLDLDSPYEVVAFTVHAKYRSSDTYEGKPCVDFERLNEIYPPASHSLFAPMTGKRLNKIRENVYREGLEKGYNFISYISTKAAVWTRNIGRNCFILEDNTVQPHVEVGDNVVMWSGNHIGHHSVIGDHVFVSSHAVIAGNVSVGKYSWLGVNCALRDNLKIAEGTLVAMGAVVNDHTEQYTMYTGNPALKRGPSNVSRVMDSL